MTPQALFSGARMAVRLAHECDIEAKCKDIIWAVYMKSEARRHRDLARYYLRSRRWMLKDEVHNGQH